MTIVQRHVPEVVVGGRRLGRHVEHDERSRDYPVARRVSGPIVSRTWRRPTKAFDQGALGSCTGNAMEGCLATVPHRRPLHRYSERSAIKLYRLATVLDGFEGMYPPTDTGSSTLAVMKAAKQLGRISGYEWCFSLNDVLAALAQHGPVCIGINWYEGFDRPAPLGMLTLAGDVRGGHELELSAVDVDARTVSGWNSWGDDWGFHGRFRMTWDTLDRLLHEQGEAAVPIP